MIMICFDNDGRKLPDYVLLKQALTSLFFCILDILCMPGTIPILTFNACVNVGDVET